MEEKDGLLTKANMAERLSVSLQEINRRLRVGSLRPHVKKGKEELFHPRQVDEQRMLSRRRFHAEPGKEPVIDFSGKDASTVFKALREGKALDDIVIEFTVHPFIVKAAAEAFAQLRGGLYISADKMKELEKMPIDGEWPIQSDTQFMEMLQGALEESACEGCKKKKRKVCLGCARSLARKGKVLSGEDED